MGVLGARAVGVVGAGQEPGSEVGVSHSGVATAGLT